MNFAFFYIFKRDNNPRIIASFKTDLEKNMFF